MLRGNFLIEVLAQGRLCVNTLTNNLEQKDLQYYVSLFAAKRRVHIIGKVMYQNFLMRVTIKDNHEYCKGAEKVSDYSSYTLTTCREIIESSGRLIAKWEKWY